MKFLLLSDMHLLWNNPVCRRDDLTTVQFEKLRFILDYADKNNLPILQAGDFFDAPRSYIFLPKVIDVFNEYPDVDIYAIFGGRRHDTYLYSNETRDATNLGILGKTGIINILGKDFVVLSSDRMGAFIYGASYGEEIPEVEGANDFNILVIHAPIMENTFSINIDYMDAKKFLFKYKDYDLILCGDIHRRFVVTSKDNRFIINTGPMLRKTADEYNLSFTPGFCVFDTEKRSINWVTIPHKPSDEVISRDHIGNIEEVDSMLEEFITEIEKDFEVGVDILQNLHLFIKKNKLPDGVVNYISETISRRKEG